MILEVLTKTILAWVQILSVTSGKIDPIVAIEYSGCVASSSQRHGVSTEAIVSVIHHESQWNPDAKSHTQDFGLGQIHCPSKWCSRHPHAKQLDWMMDPCNNIEMVADFLRTRGLHAYNPGNPSHAVSVRKIENRLARMWRKGREKKRVVASQLRDEDLE